MHQPDTHAVALGRLFAEPDRPCLRVGMAGVEPGIRDQSADQQHDERERREPNRVRMMSRKSSPISPPGSGRNTSAILGNKMGMAIVAMTGSMPRASPSLSVPMASATARHTMTPIIISMPEASAPASGHGARCRRLLDPAKGTQHLSLAVPLGTGRTQDLAAV